jgi:tRNA pseudouridine38-40 synthase
VRRIALLLEYDGAAYGGSQFQRNAPSIQGELERAIQRLTGEQVRAAFAGRTDAGVHATGQVAAFNTESRHEVETFVRALNALLPEDIAVPSAAEVAAEFDPRRHASRRVYVYRIWNAPVRAPLMRGRCWHVSAPLDVPAMAREAKVLRGAHDFASFGGAPGPGRSTWRDLRRASVRRDREQVVVMLVANAFLPHQVRRTVGALVEIGRGRLPEGTFAAWLARPCTGLAGPAAPAHGLCLARVGYRDPVHPRWQVDGRVSAA